MKRTMLMLTALLLAALVLLSGCNTGSEAVTTEPSGAEPAAPAPEPENCHLLELPDGEQIWVLDRDYDGEFDLQSLSFPSSDPGGNALPRGAIPEGFVQQAVLDCESYAAWCTACGVRQAYDDPTKHYLLIACTREFASGAYARLADVKLQGKKALVWLWDSVEGYYPEASAAYVLTVPVAAEAEELELRQVCTHSQAEEQQRLHSTEITEHSDGSIDVHGWMAYRYITELPEGLLCYCLWDGAERIYLCTDDETMAEYDSGVELLAEACTPMAEQVEGTGRWYRVGKLTVLSTEKAAHYTYAKPVIYLYPKEETEIRVKLKLDGSLSCTYPAYREGWTVTAAPDGTLTDAAGQRYNYLYWEADCAGEFDFSRGFCVRGADTAAFLEEALARLGLNRREANEFIVYWLPLMQDNPWNLIAFQGAAYTERARLEIEPAPDTLLRVYMAWKPLPAPVEIAPQELSAPSRSGFTAVEWGGSELPGEEPPSP